MELITEKNQQILGTDLGPNPNPEVKLYDFKRPDKFSKDQIRTISIMHETFSRLCTTSISAMLRCLAHMNVEMVDQTDYESFIRSMPLPTVLFIINMDPLKGSAIFEFSPNLADAMIDRVFGGRGRESGKKTDLTDIEQSIMEGISLRILGNLKESYSTVLDLRPRLGQIETNPQFAQIVPPTEMVVVVTMNAKINDVAGTFRMCLPYLTLEPIMPMLTAQYWYSSVRRKKSETCVKVQAMKTASSVYFEGENLSLEEISLLKKGSMVAVPGYDRRKAFLNSGGRDVLELRLLPSSRRTQMHFSPKTDNHPLTDQTEKELPATKNAAPSLTEIMSEGLSKLSREWTQQMGDLKKQLAALNVQSITQPDMNGHGDSGITNTSRGRPFGFIKYTDIDYLANMLKIEHPQLIAFILSCLEPALASLMFPLLPEEIQVDIARRIVRIESVAPEVLRETERVIQRKFKYIQDRELIFPKGPEILSNLLGITNRTLEKKIVDALEAEDPELAAQVKAQYFVFEDIVLLDPDSLMTLKKQVNEKDWILALKSVDPKVKEYIFSAFSKEETARLEERIVSLGRIRLQAVEEAQMKIVQIIKELEETGEIIINRV
ncbi:MAG: flagellar motor switch protein FliM [Spirochaetales bacterium]|nr:flagellar motor switch protein FliM [Spirochaetales bacterium]